MNNLVRTIIIDDENKGRNVLMEMIARYCTDVEVVATAPDGAAGIKAIKQYAPDCILLDIQMPRMDGFAMLDQLEDAHGEIIFVTAHNEYAIKAFKYAAFDYLLKPVDPKDLVEVFERLRRRIKQPGNNKRMHLLKSIIHQPNVAPAKITISSAEGITIVNIADIIYLQAEGPYTFFFMGSGEKLVASVNLQKYEELLGDQLFFRTHHSYLVNLNHIRKYNKTENSILLSNGHTVDVSKRKKEEFLQVLSEL
ncbi:MAG TPA: LytTR family DNA-binding domain-containing protein [Chitinophagaceae bacterium]|nr:LytTR family DNA-binding domain-containing protein [Chitinophagaceae bacterium]